MEVTTSSYLGTLEGKTVFIQIEITRIGVGVTNANARLNLKQGLSGENILIEDQPLIIGGANIFSIVFNIPDANVNGNATALIDFTVTLRQDIDGIALTQFPATGRLVFGSDDGGNGNGNGVKKGSILTKVLGLTALAGTTALLATRRR